MDAKVLRAAVSAAIRVTVSTTLIGCGGNVTSAGGSAPEKPLANDSPAKTKGPVTNHDNSAAAPPSTAGNGWSLAPSSGGQVGNAGGGSTVAQGGVASLGGSPDGGSADGGDGPVKPIDTCGAVDACLNRLDAQAPSAPLDDVDRACCQTVIDGLTSLQAPEFAECWPDLNGRFMLSARHQACCGTLQAWQVPACTPWGPPVPPELAEDALSAWEAAA
jgi:hypothetical protein